MGVARGRVSQDWQKCEKPMCSFFNLHDYIKILTREYDWQFLEAVVRREHDLRSDVARFRLQW